MTEARRDQWANRLRRLRDAEAARTAAGDYFGADRVLEMRKATQQRWAREVFLPLVPA